MRFFFAIVTSGSWRLIEYRVPDEDPSIVLLDPQGHPRGLEGSLEDVEPLERAISRRRVRRWDLLRRFDTGVRALRSASRARRGAGGAVRTPRVPLPPAHR